ncbi:hypothetical protein BDQ17DRAFT_1356980 [Cyathus striatus]|nr:hypothetical protein BDQ17DRAFT_1356980 [Cyathus striatus]
MSFIGSTATFVLGQVQNDIEYDDILGGRVREVVHICIMRFAGFMVTRYDDVPGQPPIYLNGDQQLIGMDEGPGLLPPRQRGAPLQLDSGFLTYNGIPVPFPSGYLLRFTDRTVIFLGARETVGADNLRYVPHSRQSPDQPMVRSERPAILYRHISYGAQVQNWRKGFKRNYLY